MVGLSHCWKILLASVLRLRYPITVYCIIIIPTLKKAYTCIVWLTHPDTHLGGRGFRPQV